MVSTTGNSNSRWELLDPFGQQVWQTALTSDRDTEALAFTGTYTLLVEGYVGNTAPFDYSFNVQKVTDTTAALTIGATTSGAITQVGQQNIYTFTLDQAGRYYFDSLANDGQLTWTLAGPRGVEVPSFPS